MFERDDDPDVQPQKAFRISINGEPFCEADDLTTVTMVVDRLRQGARRITLYARANEGPLEWMTADLDTGDQVVIEIVDVASADEAPMRCDFCNRTVHDVSRLIASTSTRICDGCVTAFSGRLRGGGDLPAGTSIQDQTDMACGFCATAPPAVHGLIVSEAAAICPECLRTAADLIASNE